MSSKAVFKGVVLAGGQSSRMGSDKANLILKNKTLLQNACELLTAAGASDVLISRNVQSTTAQYIADIYPGSGPLGGLICHCLLARCYRKLHQQQAIIPTFKQISHKYMRGTLKMSRYPCIFVTPKALNVI